MRYGFAKHRRLLRRTDFVKAQRCGIRARTRHFVMIGRVRAQGEGLRLGLIAARRVGNAVQRNRGKRRIREWFRMHTADVADPFDIAVVLRSGAHSIPTRALWRELDRALAGVLRKLRENHKIVTTP